MKAARWILVIVLVAFLAGGGLLTTWLLWKPTPHDFNKLGGTVLLYELDPEKSFLDVHFDPERDMSVLVEALQRRLDPNKLGVAYVSAADNGRVEIRIPRASDDHAAVVGRVKDLVTKIGRLEFRILANEVDDAKAIEDARRVFDWADMDPFVLEELKKAAELGFPPPSPREANKSPRRYQIATRTAPSHVTYSWIELGPQERRALNLDNAAENDPTRNEVWHQAKAQRGRAVQLSFRKDDPQHKMLQGALFYSRMCEDRRLPEDERKNKAVEYFVLARDPEFKSADSPERTPRIDGSYLSAARLEKDGSGRPAVSFTFDAAGGDLFAALTRKNVSEGEGPEGTRIRRHLAIILDGMVMSAPSINSEIRSRGQISGNFTDKEVESIANILRAGALPASLKSAPVSETEVAPAPAK